MHAASNHRDTSIANAKRALATLLNQLETSEPFFLKISRRGYSDKIFPDYLDLKSEIYEKERPIKFLLDGNFYTLTSMPIFISDKLTIDSDESFLETNQIVDGATYKSSIGKYSSWDKDRVRHDTTELHNITKLLAESIIEKLQSDVENLQLGKLSSPELRAGVLKHLPLHRISELKSRIDIRTIRSESSKENIDKWKIQKEYFDNVLSCLGGAGDALAHHAFTVQEGSPRSAYEKGTLSHTNYTKILSMISTLRDYDKYVTPEKWKSHNAYSTKLLFSKVHNNLRTHDFFKLALQYSGNQPKIFERLIDASPLLQKYPVGFNAENSSETRETLKTLLAEKIASVFQDTPTGERLRRRMDTVWEDHRAMLNQTQNDLEQQADALMRGMIPHEDRDKKNNFIGADPSLEPYLNNLLARSNTDDEILCQIVIRAPKVFKKALLTHPNSGLKTLHALFTSYAGNAVSYKGYAASSGFIDTDPHCAQYLERLNALPTSKRDYIANEPGQKSEHLIDFVDYKHRSGAGWYVGALRYAELAKEANERLLALDRSGIPQTPENRLHGILGLHGKAQLLSGNVFSSSCSNQHFIKIDDEAAKKYFSQSINAIRHRIIRERDGDRDENMATYCDILEDYSHFCKKIGDEAEWSRAAKASLLLHPTFTHVYKPLAMLKRLIPIYKFEKNEEIASYLSNKSAECDVHLLTRDKVRFVDVVE